MAAGYSHIPGDLDAVQNDRNQSQTTILLPPAPTLERVSAYYPKKDLSALEDSNLDPFYLEQSLPDTVPWDSTETDVGDAHEGPDQYFMLPTSTSGGTLSRASVYRNSARPQRDNQSTASALELKGSLGFQQHEAHYPEDARFCSEESFSSSQSETTPDLSPSSSFSSYCSPSNHPKAVVRATELLYQHIKSSEGGSQSDCCSYPPPRHNTAAPLPSPPIQSTMPKPRRVPKPLEIANSSHWWKPLPSPPTFANSPGGYSGKKTSSDSSRPQIEPSMISPPSLLDPVTLEPHPTHFDQAFFIPATHCPSPVPSPTTRLPLIERDGNIVQRAPSISSLDRYHERSAWDSDSDSDSISRKSLSRKTNDTLRKVRSRAKLRVAKSIPKLSAAKQEDSNPEQLPPAQSQLQEEFHICSTPTIQDSLSKYIFSAPEQETLRLVAPSATSLPRIASRENSIRRESDMDPSTAAAMQAKSRRRHRVTTETYPPARERYVGLYHGEYSDDSIDDKTRRRDPFFKRFWRSMRAFSCHTGLPENRPRSF